MVTWMDLFQQFPNLQAYDIFYEKITTKAEISFSLKMVISKNLKLIPWMTPDLIKSKNDGAHVHDV